MPKVSFSEFFSGVTAPPPVAPALGFDPIGDFETIVDGLTPIVISSRGSEAESAVEAMRRAVSVREAEKSSGAYTTNDSVFHVSTVAYPTKLPLGSTITDADGVVWVVIECSKQTLNARWRYIVRDLTLVGQTELDVWHEIATFAKGPTGAQVETWVRQPEPLRARFQPISEERRVENGSVHSPERFIGYFEKDFDFEHNHRFLRLNGDGETIEIYKAIRAMNRESITDLFAVECEVTKFPLA